MEKKNLTLKAYGVNILLEKIEIPKKANSFIMPEATDKYKRGGTDKLLVIDKGSEVVDELIGSYVYIPSGVGYEIEYDDRIFYVMDQKNIQAVVKE